MVIFAQMDFGAVGYVILLVMIGWAVVLAICVGGIILGARLLRRGSLKLGWMLVLASCFLPVFCYVAPPHLFRLAYGSYPIQRYPKDRIDEGMSGDEVVVILGSPHERQSLNGMEKWYYRLDPFCINSFCVTFGPDGRVMYAY
jgi:hypothetical protein